MKQLFLSNIIAYVKARLDELSNNEDSMLVANNQAVEDLEKEIEAAIIPSVRKIHLDAPNVLLRDGENLGKYVPVPVIEGGSEVVVEPTTLIFPCEGGTQNVSVYTKDNWGIRVDVGQYTPEYSLGMYKYIMPIPRNFLRLITLQMSDWERPIQTLVNEDSAEYRKQTNKYLCGTWMKPIGAIVHRWMNDDCIELFSCKTTGASMKFGQYVPEPEISFDPNNKDYYVKICSPLESPCLNQITAEVLRSIGQAQEAMVYDRKAVQPFYIDPDYARLNPPVGERFNTTAN